jgi:hypothetical protein
MRLAQLRRAEQECIDVQETLNAEHESAVEVQRDVVSGIQSF